MKFSSNEAIDAIDFWDRNVEMVGYITSIMPRRSTGKNDLMKFYLSNGAGRNVQCVMWGSDDIDSIEKFVSKHQILHIDGAFSRVPSKPEYNQGNVKFELQLSKKTSITSFGKHVDSSEVSTDIPKVDLCDTVHFEDKKIAVFGYIKTMFKQESFGTKSHCGTYGCGTMTNGTHKLEVRIASYNHSLTCKKGDPVYVTGTIKSQGHKIYLQIEADEDIEVLEERGFTLEQLLDGFRELKRCNDAQLTKDDLDDNVS